MGWECRTDMQGSARGRGLEPSALSRGRMGDEEKKKKEKEEKEKARKKE